MNNGEPWGMIWWGTILPPAVSEPKRLKLHQIWADYARELGAETLTPAQKRQAFLAAIMDALEGLENE